MDAFDDKFIWTVIMIWVAIILGVIIMAMCGGCAEKDVDGTLMVVIRKDEQ